MCASSFLSCLFFMYMFFTAFVPPYVTDFLSPSFSSSSLTYSLAYSHSLSLSLPLLPPSGPRMKYRLSALHSAWWTIPSQTVRQLSQTHAARTSAHTESHTNRHTHPKCSTHRVTDTHTEHTEREALKSPFQCDPSTHIPSLTN